MGADLATAPKAGKGEKFPPAKLQESRITVLEQEMDQWQTNLKPLTSFILPGGSPLVAHLHMARTICRRAERHVVALREKEEILGPAVAFLNRLSDHLFVLSRYIAHVLGEDENLWKY